MWTLAIIFVLVLLLRYVLRAYQQQQTVNEVTPSEATSQASTASSKQSDESEPRELTKSQTSPSNAPAQDYDEHSTGHNVTKILTGPGSRKFHLSQEQIEQGNKVNRELLERMAKRKIHAE